MSSSEPTRAPVLVAGLGNPLMSDEGVGVRVVEELERTSRGLAGVEFLDLGTSDALRLLHAMAGRRKAVFIDCALMGLPPGTIRRFAASDVRDRKTAPRLTVHEGHLLDALNVARNLGQCPADVVIFGVQPGSLAPGDALSPAVRERFADYIEAVRKEVTAPAVPSV